MKFPISCMTVFQVHPGISLPPFLVLSQAAGTAVLGTLDDVMMSPVSFSVRHAQHPTPCSVSHFFPQLQASWNPAAEPPAPFSLGLWKTQ